MSQKTPWNTAESHREGAINPWCQGRHTGCEKEGHQGKSGAVQFRVWRLFCLSSPSCELPFPGAHSRAGWPCQGDIQPHTAQAPQHQAGSSVSWIRSPVPLAAARRVRLGGRSCPRHPACPAPPALLHKCTACHNSLLNAKLPIINKHGPNNSSPDLTHCRKQPQK